MTNSELIKYSANEVKKNKTLFAEFIRIYKDEFGSDPDCSSCAFNSTFLSWKNTKQKQIIMARSKNTFKLINDEFVIRVSATEVLGKNSSDEVALAYLNDHKGRYRKEREKNFRQLPTEAVKETAKKKPAKKTAKKK